MLSTQYHDDVRAGITLVGHKISYTLYPPFSKEEPLVQHTTGSTRCKNFNIATQQLTRSFLPFIPVCSLYKASVSFCSYRLTTMYIHAPSYRSQ